MTSSRIWNPGSGNLGSGIWYLVLGIFFVGCADTKDPVALGRAGFQSHGCATCHAVGPDGPATGTNLSFIGFTHSPEWLDLWLKEPKAWKPDTAMRDQHLSDSARASLVAYLGTLKGESWNGALPSDGRALFHAVGCAGCHGKDGRGGFPNNNAQGGLVPALTQVRSGYTRDELIRRIANGVAHPLKKDPAGPEPLLSMPAWGRVLEPGQIAAIADYLIANSTDKGTEW
jgi:mono/diheme cytochrome c family protein